MEEFVADLVLNRLRKLNFACIGEDGGDGSIHIMLVELLLHLEFINLDGLGHHQDNEVEGGDVLLFEEGIVVSGLESELFTLKGGLDLGEGFLLILIWVEDEYFVGIHGKICSKKDLQV